MRKITATVATLIACSALIATTASPPASANIRPSIQVAPSTSPIWLYDFDTAQPEPATYVYAQVSHCPAGGYGLSETLVQDGVRAVPAMYGAMGWQLFTCTGAASQQITTVGFYSPTLHPGRATVTVRLANGDRTITKKARVQIPQ